MKKHKVKYTNEPIGQVEIVDDFLPSPEELVVKDDMVKITLSLTRESVDFFKQHAKANNTQYQKMIRELLQQYANRHK